MLRLDPANTHTTLDKQFLEGELNAVALQEEDRQPSLVDARPKCEPLLRQEPSSFPVPNPGVAPTLRPLGLDICLSALARKDFLPNAHSNEHRRPLPSRLRRQCRSPGPGWPYRVRGGGCPIRACRRHVLPSAARQ